MMTMVMWETYIIKGRLADGKFDCFPAVSHQLNHMVPGRPGDHDDDAENDDDGDNDGNYVSCDDDGLPSNILPIDRENLVSRHEFVHAWTAPRDKS